MGDRSHAKLDAFVEKILDDPMMALAMEADGVDMRDARALLSRVSLTTYGPPDSEGSDRYRRGVGIALFNKSGLVWVGQRSDFQEAAWQLPQGGIDSDESPIEAACRELREELGIDRVALLEELDGWLRYDLPAELVGRTWAGHWRGQEQRWIAMRFLGDDAEIDIATAHPEFSAWQWKQLAEIPGLAAPFKRPVYEVVAARFSAHAVPVGQGSPPSARARPR